MKAVANTALMLCSLVLSSCALLSNNNSWHVDSPNNKTRITLELTQHQKTGESVIFYHVQHGAATVIKRSPLGLETDGDSFSRGLEFRNESSKKIKETYSLPNGKQSKVVYKANEKTISFLNADGERLDIVLRASNDGVAFRYELPDSGSERVIINELTGYHIPPGKAFMMPYDEPSKYLPAYENYYEKYEVGTTSPKETGWAFPALFKICDGDQYVLLTESALYGQYCGIRLQDKAPDGLYQVRFPEAGDGNSVGAVNPTIITPWQSPWRAIIIGDNPGDIVESTMVTDLAEAPRFDQADWIKPGRAAWSWWSESDSPRNFARQRDFIDLAADMGWEYYLVDANWNLEPKADLLNFIDYAGQKNVGVLLWYNSGGPNNIVAEAPRDRLYTRDRRREEFKWLHEIGAKGIKVDFWQSDKQQAMQYYVDLLQDAYEFELLVNFHGCTIPRGWERTFPNFMTDESVRGAESYKFAQEYPEKAPQHNVNLAFTRNAIGPMDYTPVTFSDMNYPHLTTNAHELALSVVFQSGITHFADKPESYRAQPRAVQNFLRQVPVVWDETRFIAGEPNDFIVLARRSGDRWFIAGINGKSEPRSIDPALASFGKGEATLIGDQDARAFNIQKIKADKQQVQMAPYGGFVIVLKKD